MKAHFSAFPSKVGKNKEEKKNKQNMSVLRSLKHLDLIGKNKRGGYF